MIKNQAYRKIYQVYSGQSTTTEAVPVNSGDLVKGSLITERIKNRLRQFF